MTSMRRVFLPLFLILTLAAGAWFGSATGSAAVTVNGHSAHRAQILRDVAAIQQSPSFSCYFAALYQVPVTSSLNPNAPSTAAVASWTNFIVQSYAIENYEAHFGFQMTKAQYADAATSLEASLTSTVSKTGRTCPDTAAVAIGSLPQRLQEELVVAHAASMAISNYSTTSVNPTAANLLAFYQANTTQYQILCLSDAVVPLANQSSFQNAVASGESPVAAIRQYSITPNAATGGSLGCFGPSSPYYASARSAVAGTTPGRFGNPVSATSGTTQVAVYFILTSATQATFAQSKAQVANDISTHNESVGQGTLSALIKSARVELDSSLGMWGDSNGVMGVFPPTSPAATLVPAPLGSAE
jgi:hypothetical protein